MGNLNRKTQIIILVLIGLSLIAALVYVFFRTSGMETPAASTDDLGQGIIDRWGAGLPEGYSAVYVDSLEAEGYLFARLTYETSVNEVLAQWNTVDDALSGEYFEIYNKHCAAQSLSDKDASLLESNKPYPNFTWIGYKLTGDNGEVLILLYDTVNSEMFLAEQQ